MNRNDMLARQREALQAFRRAEALRAEQEKEARELRPKAEKEAEALHTKLNKLLAEAHQQFEQGLASLERVALARLLDEKRLWTEPKVVKADPVAELARSVEDASRAVADLDRSVEALIRRRRRRKKILETALSWDAFLFGIGGSLLGFICSCISTGFLYLQTPEEVCMVLGLGALIGFILLWIGMVLSEGARG
jgi:hypothetical protein